MSRAEMMKKPYFSAKHGFFISYISCKQEVILPSAVILASPVILLSSLAVVDILSTATHRAKWGRRNYFASVSRKICSVPILHALCLFGGFLDKHLLILANLGPCAGRCKRKSQGIAPSPICKHGGFFRREQAHRPTTITLHSRISSERSEDFIAERFHLKTCLHLTREVARSDGRREIHSHHNARKCKSWRSQFMTLVSIHAEGNSLRSNFI